MTNEVPEGLKKRSLVCLVLASKALSVGIAQGKVGVKRGCDCRSVVQTSGLGAPHGGRKVTGTGLDGWWGGEEWPALQMTHKRSPQGKLRVLVDNGLDKLLWRGVWGLANLFRRRRRNEGWVGSGQSVAVGLVELIGTQPTRKQPVSTPRCGARAAWTRTPPRAWGRTSWRGELGG